MYQQTGGAQGGDIHGADHNIAGVQYTTLAACMLIASFIPKGAYAFNPGMLGGEILNTEISWSHKPMPLSTEVTTPPPIDQMWIRKGILATPTSLLGTNLQIVMIVDRILLI